MPYSGVEAWVENDRMWAAEYRRQRAEIDEELAGPEGQEAEA